ncbi:hypothetical protein V1503_19495 [Bacillus sp. SCS-151]|uniref:hypothetical protein n=1 Tax=Nanhaiella sioensis TaxID=3115293 RepID=UPI00397B52BF
MNIFRDRMIISLKYIGKGILTLLCIPVALLLFMLFFVLVVNYEELARTLFKWMIGLPLVIGLTCILCLSIWTWIHWQFVEPYKKWKEGETFDSKGSE